MTALLFLVGSALLGIGLTRRVLRGLLSHAEQLLWGTVAGWMLTTLGAYGVARVVGRLNLAPVLALAVVAWVAAVILWLPTLKGARRRGASLRSLWRGEYAGLLLVLLLFAPIYWELFSTRMLQAGRDGVYSGGSTWFDLKFHLAVTTSFLYAQNYPPVYTPHPPEPLLYPFLPDFQTAVLMLLGMSPRAALIFTAVPLALAITGLFYSLACRLLRSQGCDAVHAQASAVLATILFLLNGGVGFIYFLEDWRRSKKGFLAFWSSLELNYASLGHLEIYWTNIITAFVAQRTSLYGVAAALMAFTLFAAAWHLWTERGGAGGGWEGWRLLLPAGVLVGSLPLFHTHSYMAVGLVSGFLFLLRPRRAWLAFWAPAVLLAAPHLVSLQRHVTADGFMHFMPGWKAHAEVSLPLYLLRNFGVPLLLAVPAWLAAPRRWRRFYLAFAALLVFSFLFVVTPNDYDNVKLMYYWYAMTCVLLASWLVRLAALHRQRLLAFLLTLSSIASGLLALQHESLSRRLFFSHEEMDAAAFVRDHTPRRALFLTAPTPHQPVLSLAGRPVLRSDLAWLWSHGYEFRDREADVRSIYAGGPEALELLRHYGVDYVYLGPDEKAGLHAEQSFFEQNFPAFYRGPNITVYDTRALTGPAERPPGGGAAGERLPGAAAPREFASRVGKDPYQWLVEFPRAGYAVYRYYKVAFGRMPRYEEMSGDMEIAGRGVFVSAPGWRETLEGNKRALTDELTSRPDFKSLFDGKGGEAYVDALYANAGVVPARAEREALVSALNGGSETRAGVLRRVAEDRRLYRREFNAAYVLMHWFGYLRRNPEDPPDRNMDGFNFWLGDLNKTGDRRSLSRAFIESHEYKGRFGK